MKKCWFDQLTIDCYQGDLLQTKVEAIVCNVNVMLDLNYSLGRQLLNRCGPALARELTGIRATLPGNLLKPGQAVWVNAQCPLPVKAVIFFGWWSADNEFTVHLIYKSFVNVLRTTFAHDCRSIAFPLFGSGSGSMNFQLFPQTVYKALQELNRLKTSSSFSIEELPFHFNRPSTNRAAGSSSFPPGDLTRKVTMDSSP